MNHHKAIVEEIGLRDLHASDEDLGSCGADIVEALAGDSDTTARTQGLNLRTEGKLPEIVDSEEARHYVLPEEVRDRARDASPER